MQLPPMMFCVIVRFPEQRLSVAVFCNRSDCDPGRRAREVAELYLEDRMASPTRPNPDDDDRDEVRLSGSELAEYAGRYRSPELDTSYDVFVEDGQLIADHFRNDRTRLTPVGDDIFTGDQWWFPEVRFLRDDSGRIHAFTVTGVRVRDLVFERASGASR